jgi:sterol desaturase/sphingolipid hydroxylase (fatty acid hydroxylase superfamily)
MFSDLFRDAISWYTDHAATIFVVLVGSAILMEQLRRRANHDVGHQVGSDRTSITSGLVFLAVKGVIGKLAAASLALFVFDHFRLFTLDLGSPWIWIGVFAARDLVYYWVHRAEHRVRVLWASHMVHHSPETIGFTTAVRVPWMEALYKPWIGLWLPLVGFHPVAAIALDVLAASMAQLYHTESVRRMPILERIFVTPSSHRVHHGSNPEYIDKNFGAVFIIWDHVFDTFEPEAAPVRYGIGSKKIDTPAGALVGGYPALAAEMGTIDGWSGRLIYALAPPA